MIKKNFISKVITAAMVMMVGVSVIRLMSVSASSKDRKFNFTFTNVIQGAITTMEPKDNSSSVYMNCVDTNTSYVAHVVGGDSSIDASADDHGMGKYYLFNYGGCMRFMYNDVYESGCPDAGVYAESSRGYAYGNWSPDSVPQSGVLPPTDYIK